MAAVQIGEQLHALKALQAVDTQLYALRRERHAGPATIEALNAAHQREVQQVTTAEAQLKTLQLKRGEREGDLATKEASVKKLQMQLCQVKTNKEYTALQHEIGSVKADNSVLEEEILKVMEQVDQQKAAVASAKAMLGTQEAQWRAAVAVIERKMAELDGVIARQDTQRATVLPLVDAALLARYERILERKEGVACVPVRVAQEACGGCHMNVPPQMINEIRLQERVITCESCARILYYPDDSA